MIGGASQTRTGDTRLFRSRNRHVGDRNSVVEHRLQSVVAIMEVHTSAWLVGCIAVTVAVKTEQFMSGEIATGSMLGLGAQYCPEAILGKAGLLGSGMERAVTGTLVLGRDDERACVHARFFSSCGTG